MQAAVDEEDATFAGRSGSDYAEQKLAVAVVEGAWQDDGRPGNGGPLLSGWEVGAPADVGPHLRFGRACLRGLPG